MRRAAPLLAALALAAGAAQASALPPRPAALSVVGGTDAWHAERGFSLTWSEPAATFPPLVRAGYLVRDPLGETLATGTVNRVGAGLGPLLVPAAPGSYSAEIWFEDAAGGRGPAASAPLRFDDVRPGPVAPGPVPEWIGRAELPLRVPLGRPPAPLPLSGIRGYAASVDSDPGGAPCAAPDRCSEGETTLRNGIDPGRLSIANLPEGTSYLHVVAVSGSGMKSEVSGSVALHVDTTDPLTSLSGAPAGWTDRAVTLTAEATDGGAGMTPGATGPPPFTAIRVDGGAPSVARGTRVTVEVIAEGAHRVAHYARDAAGNVAGGGGATPAPPTAWVRIDRTPPRVAFANSQDPGDPELIRARIVDPLAGPDPTRGWIGVRRAGSGDRFERLPAAAPARGELRARWDSDAQPSGEYEFRAIGYDAAGNSTATTRRADGTPMVLANPLKSTTRLTARFNRPGRGRTAPYGRRLLVRGRLTTGLHSPLGGRAVRAIERFAAGSRPRLRVTRLETGPDGRFRLRTSPGPSRAITLAFDGEPTLARSGAPPLRLRVRSRVHLRASAAVARVGGRPLVFHGRLAAPRGAVPRGGASVELQFRVAGLPWAEFRTVETDRRGRFRYAYRFSDDDSRGARFQFRAHVPAQQNWPYEPASSRPVLVRGT